MSIGDAMICSEVFSINSNSDISIFFSIINSDEIWDNVETL